MGSKDCRRALSSVVLHWYHMEEVDRRAGHGEELFVVWLYGRWCRVNGRGESGCCLRTSKRKHGNY